MNDRNQMFDNEDNQAQQIVHSTHDKISEHFTPGLISSSPLL